MFNPLKKHYFFGSRLSCACFTCACMCTKNAKKLNYIAIPFICHLYDHSVTTQS